MSVSVDYQHPSGYRESGQDNAFEYDTGVIVLPVASRTAAHKLIRLHGGVGTRRVKFNLKREGNPPIAPAMHDTSGDTFLCGTVVPSLPTPSTSGHGYDWSISGEYVYVQTRPRIAGTDALPVGQHPFVCPDQAAEAERWVGSAVSVYSNSSTEPFQAAVSVLQSNVKTNSDGTYTWPFLAYPPMFFTTHTVQD